MRTFAAKILSIFLTTYSYACEPTFVLKKNIKSRVRSNLLDENLEYAVTELEPDYLKLIKEIEYLIDILSSINI